MSPPPPTTSPLDDGTSSAAVAAATTELSDVGFPMKRRFRALFALRNLGGLAAVEGLAHCMIHDDSALLKHECAYCLGQMGDSRAVPYLIEALEDSSQEPMVRHEAGEALGAIGLKSSLPVLEKYASDPVAEVAETCQLAIQRIRWLHDLSSHEETLPPNPYYSVDPAPPNPVSSPTLSTKEIEDLKTVLLDDDRQLFERYRALFTLRNCASDEAVAAIAQGLFCPASALFRHEIAYVLGQIQSGVAIPQLREALENLSENEMVRHECAEALGSIADEECTKVLEKYVNDEHRVVRESCEVALDMCEYENSGDFQYANTITEEIHKQII